MQILIKAVASLAFSAVFLGCVRAPQAEDKLQSLSAYDWHDGSTGGLYGIGKDWKVSLSSAEYVTVTEIFFVHEENLPFIYMPAEYEWVKDDSVGPNTEPEMVMQLVKTPATYRMVTETVVIKPERTEYDLILPIFSDDGKIITPAKIVKIHKDAIIGQQERRVVNTPERVEEKLMPVEHRTGYRRVIKTPASVREPKYQPAFTKGTRTLQAKPWRFVVSKDGSGVSHTFDNYDDFKRFEESLQ